MFLHRNDQKMTTFNYFGPRILFVRPERTVGNNGKRINFNTGFILVLSNLVAPILS